MCHTCNWYAVYNFSVKYIETLWNTFLKYIFKLIIVKHIHVLNHMICYDHTPVSVVPYIHYILESLTFTVNSDP